MSLLEVVLATFLLALLASALASTVAFANRSEVNRYKRLAAFEVANRIMLQYVDQEFNQDLKPDRPVEYEGMRFAYEIFKEQATVDSLDEAKSPPGQFNNGMRMLRVRVYELIGAGAAERRGPKLAELIRPNHMLMATFRNSDAQGRNVTDKEWLAQLSKLQPGPGGGNGGGGSDK